MLASSHKCTCRDSKRKFRKFQILQIIEFVKSIKRDHCNKIKLKIKNERDWLKKKRNLFIYLFLAYPDTISAMDTMKQNTATTNWLRTLQLQFNKL